MNNISLGNMVNANSTLFIQYRVGGGKSSNLGAGAINGIGTIDFVVAGPSQQINQSVVASLSLTNITAAIGGANQMSVEEIRNYISYNFSAQQRAVTIKDYVARVRTMPSAYGAPAKVSATEIENKIIINILSYTPDGKLTSNVTPTLVNNIANYLSNYRMLNDYINVGAAKVVDLGIEVDLILDNSSSQGEVISNVITKVSDYFNVDKMEMGTDLNLGQLKSEIMNQPGVLNIVDLKVFNKVGGQYSQSVSAQPYINQTTKQIGLLDDTVFAQANEVLQIRYPNKDIAIRVKKPIKPTFI